MTDDRTRGVHLTDKQLVFVVMAATVVAGVVFLFGVLVGRGVPLGRAGAAEGAMVTSTQVVSDGGADPPPADPGAKPGTDLSYAERLGKTPPAERLKLPVDTVPPQPPAETAPPEVGEEISTPPGADAASRDFTVQVAATKTRVEAETIVKSLKAKGFDARVFVPDPGDKVGGFRVRVGAFKTQKEAAALAQLVARETRYKDPWITR
jgi:cell division septation protein DedD